MSITGKTSFTDRGQELGFTLSDFWEYQYTNIFDLQEYLAEFIVGKALGIDKSENTDGWTLFDMQYRGLRIEVKETAYYHSWLGTLTNRISPVRSFDIHKAHCVYKDPSSELKRNNDVCVFCLNTGKDRESSNPMCMENWEFYVVATSVINERCGDQKKVSLGRIRSFTKACSFAELRCKVDEVIDATEHHIHSI